MIFEHRKLECYNKNNVKVLEIKTGLKVECDETKLNQIQNNEYIKDNFKLNIKQIDKSWYSVYFAEKEE